MVVPTKYDRPAEVYATDIKGRHPEFKIHKTLGHARAALTHRGNRWGQPHGCIYHLNGKDEWVVFEEYNPDLRCVKCGEIIADSGTVPWRSVVVVNEGTTNRTRKLMHRNCMETLEATQYWIYFPSKHEVVGPFKDEADAVQYRFTNEIVRGVLVIPHSDLKNYNNLKKVKP
jgi:hypothetical protein